MWKIVYRVGFVIGLAACSSDPQGPSLTDPGSVSAHREEAPILSTLPEEVEGLLRSIKKWPRVYQLSSAPPPAAKAFKFTRYAREHVSEVVHRKGKVSVVKTTGNHGEIYDVYVGNLPLSAVAPNGIRNKKNAPRRFSNVRQIESIFDLKKIDRFSNKKIDGVSPRDLATSYKTVVLRDGVKSTYFVEVVPSAEYTQHVMVNGTKYLLHTIQLKRIDLELETGLKETALIDYVPVLGMAHSESFMWYTWNESRAVGTKSVWQITVSPDVEKRVKAAAIPSS